MEKESKNIIKKTLYIYQALNKQLKLKAVIEGKTETQTINQILSEYFTENKIETK